MEKNRLAIVIPFYKIDFFEETIKSVAEQTDQRFTLYIGNDASPNNPLPLIEKYFPDGNYNYYDYKENIGGKNLALQWERILENVQEKWFQILGDDDIIAENFVEEFYLNYNTIIKTKSTVIRINHIQIKDDNTLIKSCIDQPKISDPKELFIKQYNGSISSTLSENIFNLNIYKKLKFHKINLAWGADHLAIYDFANQNKISYLTDTLVKVRISDQSISGRGDNMTEKKLAYQDYRKIIIKNYSHDFPKEFIIKVFKDYRNTANNFSQNIPDDIIITLLKLGEIKIVLSLLKRNFKINRINTAKKKYYKNSNQYKFKPSRYKNTFLAKNLYEEPEYNDAKEIIYCFWTGDNEMSEARKNCLNDMYKNCGVEVRLVSPKNIKNYILKDYPLHKGYNYLSNVHKADYLRAYFMYHYGGGYSDIKSHKNNWKEAFQVLNSDPSKVAIGYREIHSKYVGYMKSFIDIHDVAIQNINIDLGKHFLYLMGNGSYIFKPKTFFAKEWLEEVNSRLDNNIEALKKNPGNIMGDNKGYPLPWISILGEIFHPLCLKFHTKLLFNDNIKPSLHNYR